MGHTSPWGFDVVITLDTDHAKCEAKREEDLNEDSWRRPGGYAGRFESKIGRKLDKPRLNMHSTHPGDMSPD